MNGDEDWWKVASFIWSGVSDLKAVGKKSMEWDLNDWRWDGDLFMAAPLNPVASDCRSRQSLPGGSDAPVNNGALNSFSSGSDEAMLGQYSENKDLERRRKFVEIHEQVNEEGELLNLKLGGQVYPVMERELDKCEEKSGKNIKVSSGASIRAVCQVDDCKADLSNAKDYHRRHKVCDVHSKSTSAVVGNVMQRFCQQCSRFHFLQEFDEGKRSCRRRLAGHNKRRRKTHPENELNATSLNDEQGGAHLLISLIRILANVHSSSSDQTKDQDLLSHILRNLVNLAGSTNEANHARLHSIYQDFQNAGTSRWTAVKDSTRHAQSGVPMPSSSLANKTIVTNNTEARSGVPMPSSSLANKTIVTNNTEAGVTDNASAPVQSALLFLRRATESTKANASDTTVKTAKVNNLDLNTVYDGSQDCVEDLHDDTTPDNLRNGSPVFPLWLCKDSQRFSPPQDSRNSDATRSQSPTSSGEAQSRTDRIVFKLFGKDPSDFPLVLRKQILDWLSTSPTDIESYIRPGCIVLTIYLRMDKSTWAELYCDLASSLKRLLDSSTDSFWRSGWIYTRVGHHVTFICDGQIVLHTSLPFQNHQSCRISSISPIAVSVSEDVQFIIKGHNLSRSNSRLLCALEGKYLVQENCGDMTGGADLCMEHDKIQSLSFSCVIPNVIGRGFIEVEDHGLSSSFFPFIVAEKDVCADICTLESIIEITEAANGDMDDLEARNQALDFIHELGWLLHRNCLRFRLVGAASGDMNLFPFKRFKPLIEFAIDHDWCAVVKKLLNVLFDGTVGAEQHSSVLLALLDIGLLSRAVRRKCRSMVEFLLEYHPNGTLKRTGPPKQGQLDECQYLFRPDAVGPGGLTPLHVAASLGSCEDVLDALTEDSGSVGIEAWNNARDCTGLTPHDYACLRGHYSYIHLVQRKLNKKSGKEQVVVDIPDTLSDSSSKQKVENERKSMKLASFHTEKSTSGPGGFYCRKCEQKLVYGQQRASVTIHRPVMLSMVVIAAVCVCAALLFKSDPEVLYVFRPFRWELLKYGAE